MKIRIYKTTLKQREQKKQYRLFNSEKAKLCNKLSSQKWRKKFPEKVQSWLLKNKNRLQEKRRQRCLCGQSMHDMRKSMYGITKEQYLNLKISQDNKCAICKKGSKKTLHVDHDHKTKKVRGLLCYLCNSILGYAKDNPKILFTAANYLKKV